MSNFKEDVRSAVLVGSGRSPIRFFGLILNNALALRVSQKEITPHLGRS